MSSTDDVVSDARKTVRDTKRAASDAFDQTQDDLLEFTQRKPFTALLSAFAVGVLVGKVVL
jgi:ElaB/YqjD/DUF883 family membrane-anchored ribosome-binding protein